MAAQGVRGAILSIVPHSCEEHDQCGDWCQFRKDPAARNKSLPHALDLQGDGVSAEVNRLLSSFAQNAEKLAPCGSTLANESFNNTVASKDPRVKAAGCQKNMGHGYVSVVNKENCLSSGQETCHRAIQQDKKVKKRKQCDETREAKRQSIKLKEERCKSQYQSAVKEGATYEQDIGLWHSCDVEGIPPPIAAPQNECLPSMNSSIQVMFDVETTSLATDADIIQLSAVHDKDEFNVYILPEKRISAAASRVNQLTATQGRLFHKGKPVHVEGAKEALQKFITWLKDKKKPVVLFAHNAKAFDSKRIIYSLKKYDLLSSFQDCVLGFVDTLILFKKVLPLREKYSQESLVSDVLGISDGAHDSLEDVRALQKLVTCKEVTEKQMVESSFTTDFAVSSTKYHLNKAVNLQSLQSLITTNVISKGMGGKIAGSGLTLQHLNLAFQQGGKEGLKSVLSERINGKARVTSYSRIIMQINNYFEKIDK